MTEGLHPKMGIKAQQKKTVLESFLGLGRSLSYLQLLESLFKKLASRVTLIRKLVSSSLKSGNATFGIQKLWHYSLFHG